MLPAELLRRPATDEQRQVVRAAVCDSPDEVVRGQAVVVPGPHR
jgi:hypothetical protein